ncbi:hypothetical protein [Aquidulcibacter sp.]|jgi:hypothetical protein|uniref:hypothetical protein n=1 Tax=Aquidulcibacter sp. TaxID=2052990 RepID=UPI0037BFA038
MTEPVSHTAEVRKFLFFKDSRPIAPSIGDKITATVQEMKEQVGGGFSAVMLLVMAMGMQVSPNLEGNILMFWELFLTAVWIVAILGMFASGVTAKPRTYQSGIPSKRTYGTGTLLTCLILSLVWACYVGFGSLMFEDQLGYLSNVRGVSFLVASFLTALYVLRSIQERIQWILDLRAEQGLILAQGTDGKDGETDSHSAWIERPIK